MRYTGSKIGLRLVCGRELKLIVLLVVGIVVCIPTRQLLAQQYWRSVDATFTGMFEIVGDIGQSGLFEVEEAGSGVEQAGWGTFTYTASVRHNLARAPVSCGSNSSTGVGGSAVLTFASGQVWLHRSSGAACFLFPTIQVTEEWIIAGGTGDYLGATGNLVREFSGDVRNGATTGSLQGVIRYR